METQVRHREGKHRKDEVWGSTPPKGNKVKHPSGGGFQGEGSGNLAPEVLNWEKEGGRHEKGGEKRN